MNNEHLDYRLVPIDGNHYRVEVLNGHFTQEDANRIPGCYYNGNLDAWVLSIGKSEPKENLFGDNRPQSIRAKRKQDLELELDEMEGVVRVRFSNNTNWTDIVREFPGAYRDLLRKAWTIPGEKNTLKQIVQVFQKEDCEIKISTIMINGTRNKNGNNGINGKNLCPGDFLQQLNLRGYSLRTIATYRSHINRFLHSFKEENIAALSLDSIRDYIIDLMVDHDYSPATQNQIINALKLFYALKYKREIDNSEFPHPQNPRQAPIILTRQEIQMLLDATKNHKHRTILALIYGTGMRLSEAVGVRVRDLDEKQGTITIRSGNGTGIRQVPLSLKLQEQLRKYKELYRPGHYLFEGQRGKAFTGRSVQNVFKQALEKTGISKDAHVHTLRHSFAAHLLENGTNIHQIQKLLGHQSSRTTEIYANLF